jgi:hypothetical protein
MPVGRAEYKSQREILYVERERGRLYSHSFCACSCQVSVAVWLKTTCLVSCGLIAARL